MSEFVIVDHNEAQKLVSALRGSAGRIVDYLSSRPGASESQISKALNIPLSTVNYAVKRLVDSGIILCDEYHYSSKGRVVNHYRLANRFIVISPKGEDFWSRVKGLLLSSFLVLTAASVFRIISSQSRVIGDKALRSAAMNEAALFSAQSSGISASWTGPFFLGVLAVLVVAFGVNYWYFRFR